MVTQIWSHAKKKNRKINSMEAYHLLTPNDQVGLWVVGSCALGARRVIFGPWIGFWELNLMEIFYFGNNLGITTS